MTGHIIPVRPPYGDHGSFFDPIRMIQTHPVNRPGTPLMTSGIERCETESIHHLDLIQGHGAEGIVDAVFTRFRGGAVSISAEVRRNHVKKNIQFRFFSF